MGICTDYIDAIKVVRKAHKGGRGAKAGVVAKIPCIKASYWLETMEGSLFYKKGSPNVEAVFRTFDEETQHALCFTPEKKGDYIARARFWQGALKSNLPPKEYHEAMMRIAAHYAKCIRRGLRDQWWLNCEMPKRRDF